MLNDIFKTPTFKAFIQTHAETLKSLHDVEIVLRKRFVGVNSAIDAIILSVLSGESLLLIGPPGTSKSRLIHETYKLLVPHPPSDEDYFRYLLTRFTEPSELFGFFEIKMNGNIQEIKRDRKNAITEARVVFLDEVFNASSAILNALLTFMNEREFYDRGESVDVKMQALFGATNHTPHEPELRAVFDRFTLRCEVKNIRVNVSTKVKEEASLADLLISGWRETYGLFDDRDERDIEHLKLTNIKPQNPSFRQTSIDLLDGVRRFQLSIKDLTRKENIQIDIDKDGFYHGLQSIVQNCRQWGYSQMSNRRLVKMLYVMVVDATYQHVIKSKPLEIGDDQLALLAYAVDRWDDDLSRAIKQYRHRED